MALSAAIAASLAGVSAAMAGSDLPKTPHVQMLLAADQNAKPQTGPSGGAPDQPVGRYICTPSGAGRTSTVCEERRYSAAKAPDTLEPWFASTISAEARRDSPPVEAVRPLVSPLAQSLGDS